jgi:hypothetical protein
MIPTKIIVCLYHLPYIISQLKHINAQLKINFREQNLLEERKEQETHFVLPCSCGSSWFLEIFEDLDDIVDHGRMRSSAQPIHCR